MIRINLIESLVMSQIRDSYQALSEEDKKVYDKKRKAEFRERMKKYEAEKNKAFVKEKIKTKKGQSAGGTSVEEIDRALYLPARLLPLDSPEDALVRIKKSET